MSANSFGVESIPKDIENLIGNKILKQISIEYKAMV